MKRFISILLSVIMALSLVSCGDVSKAAPISAGYLPTRLEQISEGGIVPEGCEAKKSLESSDFSIESLWGEWVLKGSATEDVHNTDQIFTYTVSGDSGEIQLEVECLPKSFTLRPSYATSDWEISQSLSFYSNSEPETDPFGEAFEALGCGYGAVEFQETEDGSDDSLMPIYISTYGTHVSCFAVSGNTLAIGITDETCFSTSLTFENSLSDLNETSITEIDYEISWTGYELTLTYNGDSVVYVPRCVEKNESWSLDQAGVISGNTPIDGIYGITFDSSAQSVLYNVNDGYENASITFNEDGSAEVNGISYTYRYSGDSLTLIAGEDIAVYSNYTVQQQSSGAAVDCSFYVGDSQLRYCGKNTLQWFIDNGFQTDLNLSQLVNPYQVTDDISLSYGDAKLLVKANNPYEKPAALKDCYVCYILINDSTGAIKKKNGFYGDAVLGQTTYEDIDLMFNAPYEKTESYLRYKTRYAGGIILAMSDFTAIDKYGAAQLDLDENLDVIYEFDNGILKDVIIQEPALLYNGLQNNVDYSVLNSMDAATMTGVIEVRDSVLDQLKAAFDDADISVNVNESTGEIVMDSTVLFDTDSSELSAEGRQYIDSFMGVYASVILDESLKDTISEVRFEGHTDSSGSYDYNLALSQERADSVLNYCLSSTSTSMNRDQKERLNDIATTIGYSFADLVYDDNGNEDADASRRVAIKFYVAVDGQDNSGTTNHTESETTSSSALTEEDFRLIYDGEEVSARTEIQNAGGNVWYFHYDGSNDMKTARGVHLGDSASAVITAYGDTDIYAFNEDNPFYDSEDPDLTPMLDDCESFSIYWYNDKDAIAFFFDDWNCVSWIVYYIA